MSENEGTLKVDSSHFLSGFDAIGEYNGEEVIWNDDGIYRTSYRNYENGHTVVFKQTFRNINEVRRPMEYLVLLYSIFGFRPGYLGDNNL